MPLYLRLMLLTGPSADVEAALPGHEQQVQRLRADGKLRAAGRLRRGEGFVEIFDASDLHDAERIAREDPLIEAGLGTWVLRELDDFEPEAAPAP